MQWSNYALRCRQLFGLSPGTVLVDQDVGGFDVPMQDAVAVSMVDGARDPRHQRRGRTRIAESIAAAVEARNVSALKKQRLEMEEVFGAAPSPLDGALGDRKEALAQLEQRPSTATAAQAEGLGPTPFTQPSYANPSEGSAT